MHCFGFIISAEQLELKHEGWIDCGFALWHHIFPDEAELLKICVLPAHRRKGMGKTLLEESQKYAINNGIKKFLLEVARNNLSAICLYECAGFKKIAQRKGYYRINEKLVDADIMALDLGNHQ
jgi:ribosomal-protein-alanine N-acetyltransferase